MIKIRVENMEALKRTLRALPLRAHKAFDEGMHTEAGLVMGEAQSTVPVLTGQLRSSAYIRDLARNQHRTDIEYGYAADYALAVHEVPRSRGYKWFEAAFHRFSPGSVRRVSALIKAAMKRGR